MEQRGPNTDEERSLADRFERFKNDEQVRSSLEELKVQQWKKLPKNLKESLFHPKTLRKYGYGLLIELGLGILLFGGLYAIFSLAGFPVSYLKGPLFIASIFGLFIAITLWIIIAVYELKSGIIRFKQEFKERIIRRLLWHYDEKLHYDPFKGISKEQVIGSLAFPIRPHQVFGVDHISGERSGIPFECSEVFLPDKPIPEDFRMGMKRFAHRKEELRVQHLIGKRLDAEKEARFIGLFFIADLGRTFSGTTVMRPKHFHWRIREDADGKKRYGPPYDPAANLSNKDGTLHMEQVNLEDPAFEERFNLYSDDPVTSRFIFSPTLMERIVELNRKWGRKPFMSFKGSKFHLGIPYEKGLFEVDPTERNYHSLLDEDELEELFYELDSFLVMLDALEFNDRIWMKGETA